MNTTPKITIIEPIRHQIENSTATVPTKLKVAAYARVSTEQDEQQSSYEAQIDYYTRHINANPDWEFVKVYADRGITGTNTKNRDEFNEMVALALSGGIDLILTKSISRFARNTVDTLQTVRDLKKAGVEVRFEKENLHTFDPKCEMMLTIMSSLAQEESRSISENVRWGQQQSMRKGKIHLAYKHFLGYKKGADGRPEIVEEEAEIIRKIFDLFLDGWTIRHIAQHLTDEGIPTPKGNSKWPVSTVENILINEKYKGDALLQKTYTEDYLTKKVKKNCGEVKQYLVEHSHEPIIDPETFDRVQELLAKRRPYKSKLRDGSPFCNKLICADCGGFFGHKVWHNHGNTKRYDIWYCNQRYRGNKVCETPILYESDIKRAFEQLLCSIGKKAEYSPERWRELVDSVSVQSDKMLVFTLNDGSKHTIAL